MTPAERGAAWLDANREGWLERVDTDRLDMSHGDFCVAGQLVGLDYSTAAVDAEAWWHNDGWAWMADHGFYVADGNQQDYDLLTDEWRGLIRERRLAGFPCRREHVHRRRDGREADAWSCHEQHASDLEAPSAAPLRSATGDEGAA